jgi:hypothetical protein
MIPQSRPVRRFLARTLAVSLLGLVAVLASAKAQTRLVIDPKASLAWWQVDPNMNHLWGTTCPQEPSWRPGEGRSGGWQTEEAMHAKTLAHGYSDVSDTVHTPLYPRRRVRFVCTEAIHGEFLVPDTAKWRGARGQLVINANDLASGENMRDAYAKSAVLSTSVYPEIKFALDSVVGISHKGDTLIATAMGNITLRGVTRPMTSLVKAYPEAGGTRIVGKFRIPVHALVDDYGVWKRTLGLGVMMDIWKWLYMGVDVLVHSESQAQLGQ